MSIKIDPRTILNDQRRVNTVRVVVHTTGPVGPTTSDNHWSIYLLLHGGGSVRLNMRANPGFVDGQLEWTGQAYELTTSAIRNWDFPVQGSLRVCDIAVLLYQYRRHQYDMSGGGSGCRYWVWVMMSDWSQKGWIAAASPTQLWVDLLYQYHKENPRKPLQMVQGSFHN